MGDPVKQALIGRLKGDAQLVSMLGGPYIYERPPQNNQAGPYVTVRKVTGVPENSLGYDVFWTRWTFDIKCVDKSESTVRAGDIDSRIKQLLDCVDFPIAGMTLMACRREQDIDYNEISSGVQYQHIGGTYGLEAA